MQAALMLRSKQRVARRKKMRNGRPELPSNVATKDIAPFPRYPPESWVVLLFPLFVCSSTSELDPLSMVVLCCETKVKKSFSGNSFVR